MEYLILPLILVVACSALGFFALTRDNWHFGLRVIIGLLAFLLSHAIVATGVYVYKELDDNSYYSASVRTLLDEITTALSADEPGFQVRLTKFTSEQSLTYENRGNLLENARDFREVGRDLRGKQSD